MKILWIDPLFLIKEIKQLLSLKVMITIIFIFFIIIFVNLVIPNKIIFLEGNSYIIDRYKSLFYITKGQEIPGQRLASTRIDMIRAG